MIVSACYITNTGKVRSANEDSLLVNDLLVTEADRDRAECRGSGERRQIYIVADGMGGHAKGEVASKTVLEAFRERYGEMESAGQIREVIGLAKERLNAIARADRNAFGLGTTVTGVALREGRAVVFNCGDSRGYRFSEDSFERITRDHSLVQELFEEGLVTEEEMRIHPQKHLITSAVTGDLRDLLPVLEVKELDLVGGQRFVLCTDGVWESMSKAEMRGCLSIALLEAAVQALFKTTMERGARDNLSVIALDIESVE